MSLVTVPMLLYFIAPLVGGFYLVFEFAEIPVDRKNYLKFMLVVLLLGTVQATLFLIFKNPDVVKMFYPLHSHLTILLILHFIFKVSLYQSVMSILLSYMCCQIPNWVSMLFEEYGDLGSNPGAIAYSVTMLIVCLVIKKYVAGLVCELIRNVSISNMVFAFVPAMYYLYDYSTSVWSNLISSNVVVIHFMPTAICIFYLAFVVAYGKEQVKRLEMQFERRIIEAELEAASNEFEALKEINERSRIYRHDIRHHFSLLLSYAEKGKVEEIKEYLKENIEGIKDITPYKFCNLEMMNLLLGHYAKLMENAGIDYTFEVCLPDRLPIPANKLCAMVSNTLENAISALEKEQDKNLIFRINEFQGKLVFVEENTCTTRVEMINGIPKSSNPREGHGFGTKSIVTIAKDHNGEAVFKQENNKFTVMVYIPM